MLDALQGIGVAQTDATGLVVAHFVEQARADPKLLGRLHRLMSPEA